MIGNHIHFGPTTGTDLHAQPYQTKTKLHLTHLLHRRPVFKFPRHHAAFRQSLITFTAMTAPLVYIIIPAFNEDAATLQQVVAGLLPLGYEVLVIDDGSETPVSTAPQRPGLHCLRHPVNLGQGAALQTGFQYARDHRADYAITFDADGQHLPADIEKLLQPLLRNEVDITLGSRFLEGAFSNAGFRRRLTLRMGRWVNYFFTGLRLTDAHNGLRGLNRRALETIELNENRMAHATEILFQIVKHKLRFKEVPVHIIYTDYSREKGQSFFNSIRIFFDLVLHKLFE
jgi:polyprenyl-phospho-N-acetylgalactosaminyl synthase